jgi:hypothetical protein
MPVILSSTTVVVRPMPTARFGPGAVAARPGIVQRTGAVAAVIVAGAALAATPVVSRVPGPTASPGRVRGMMNDRGGDHAAAGS